MDLGRGCVVLVLSLTTVASNLLFALVLTNKRYSTTLFAQVGLGNLCTIHLHFLERINRLWTFLKVHLMNILRFYGSFPFLAKTSLKFIFSPGLHWGGVALIDQEDSITPFWQDGICFLFMFCLRANYWVSCKMQILTWLLTYCLAKRYSFYQPRSG